MNWGDNVVRWNASGRVRAQRLNVCVGRCERHGAVGVFRAVVVLYSFLVGVCVFMLSLRLCLFSCFLSLLCLRVCVTFCSHLRLCVCFYLFFLCLVCVFAFVCVCVCVFLFFGKSSLYSALGVCFLCLYFFAKVVY